MKDIQGNALLDFYTSKKESDSILLYNNYGLPEEMPLEVFFRTETELPEIENYALSLCKGSILDIGAGAGCHSLILQERGHDVTALEVSAILTELIHKRGARKVVQKNIYDYNQDRYDTLLLLMNGIGLAETLNGLIHLLHHFKTLLKPGGQIIFDSSDISYLYEDNFPENKYFGEISYQYEYQKQKGDWFNWLYIDPLELKKICSPTGWNLQIVYENKYDQYLARLTSSE